MSRWPLTRRKLLWASARPAAVQRMRMSPERQRLTLRWVSRTVPIIDSMGFVEQSVRLSAPLTPRRVSVSVSSSPSLSDPAASGWLRSSIRSSALSAASACAWSWSDHALRSLARTHGRSLSGRWSSTLRSLWRWQRCTGARAPATSRTALRSALAPSSTKSCRSCSRSPRSHRSASSAVATVAFSVEPSLSESGTFVPSVVIPSATTCVMPASSMPSIITIASSRSERSRASSSSSAARVPLTNARKHPLQRDPLEQIAPGELCVRLEGDLRAVVGGPNARAADRNASAAERDLAADVPVALRRAPAVVAAPGTDDLVDLMLHALVQHGEPGTDRQREQPLLRRLGDLDHHELHVLGQRQPLRLDLDRSDLDQMYLLHGGSSCLDGLQTPVTVTTRPDKAGGPPPQLLHRAGQAPTTPTRTGNDSRGLTQSRG